MKTSQRILACPSTAKYLIITFVDLSWIPSHSIKLFAFDDFYHFSVMQSSIHEIWARFQSGKLEQRLAYNLTRAFGTFPWPKTPPSQVFAKELWKRRIQTSLTDNICFTDLYNKLHNERNVEKSYCDLRYLIRENDNAVLIAYGWEDLDLEHDFYAVSYLPEKDCVRFTISEEVRLEILRRLTALNQQYHQQEQRSVSRRQRNSAFTF